MLDRLSLADPKETARFDWSGDPCDMTNRLPKLPGLGVVELEGCLGSSELKESFRLGER